MIVTTNELTINEQRLIDILSKSQNWTEVAIDVVSPRREFDVRVSGKKEFQFSLILFRAAIHYLTNWTMPEIANMTDYPNLCLEGDWSGVRDTSELKLWMIFEKFVAPIVEQKDVIRVFGKKTLEMLANEIKESLLKSEPYAKTLNLSDWSIVMRPDGVFLQVVYNDYKNIAKVREVELTPY